MCGDVWCCVDVRRCVCVAGVFYTCIRHLYSVLLCFCVDVCCLHPSGRAMPSGKICSRVRGRSEGPTS